MKIFQVHWLYRNFGGGESYFFDLCDALEELGHEVIVVSTKDDEPHLHIEGRKEYFIENSFGLRTGVKIWPKLKQIIRAEWPDIVHLHETKGFISPYIVGKITRMRPVVQTVHIASFFCPLDTRISPRSSQFCREKVGLSCFFRCFPWRTAGKLMLLNLWKLDVTRKIDRVIVGSRFMRDLAVSNDFHDAMIDVIPMFTNKNPDCQPPCSRGDGDSHRLLYIGRIEASKGILDFLKALSNLKTRKWAADVVGDGAALDEARKMAFDLDIDKQVDFHGVIESKELDEFYRRACIFVMPSLFPESFGMSGLEAMAFGKPVIAYASGGIRDWLVHGETGFLVEPGNPELISAGLEKLLSNKEQRTQMGARARARVDKYFRKEGHLGKIMRTYRSVIETRKQGKGKG